MQGDVPRTGENDSRTQEIHIVLSGTHHSRGNARNQDQQAQSSPNLDAMTFSNAASRFTGAMFLGKPFPGGVSNSLAV